MGYVSSGMGDHFSALLVSLMALWLALVDQNPFWPCFVLINNQSALNRSILAQLI